MQKKRLCALAMRVVYHLQKKLPHLHGQPIRTLVMMVTAFLAGGGPSLGQMGRCLRDLPGSLDQKVKRMSRFLCESRFDVLEAFLSVARGIIEAVAHAHPKRMILVSMDWTDLGKYQGLWLSLPYQGRALPLACMVLEKAKALGSMTAMEEELLKRFFGLFSPALRDRLVLLADRGFAKRDLWDLIEQWGAHWAIRIPRNCHILVDGKWIELKELGLNPGQTKILRAVPCLQEDPRTVNLAIRRLRTGEAKDPEDDTWYIATDAQDIPLALSWYSRRFQIEELFRDLKSRLHMHEHRLRTEESVGKMMLIVALAYLIVLEDGTQWRGRLDLDRIQRSTPWGKLSVYRIAEICFELNLCEVPELMEEAVLSRWTNRRAA